MKNTAASYISSNEVVDMIGHWLSTPENGYLGSGYGYKDKVLATLREEQTTDNEQKIIAKMKTDIPILVDRTVCISWVAGTLNISVTIDGNTSDFQP